MTPAPMTSRQRLLAALRREPADHAPCSFMLFRGLWLQSSSYADFIERQLALGLDAFVQIPPRPPRLVSDSYNLYGLPVEFDPAVKVREWKDTPAGERWPVLVKEYQTPGGLLRAEVYQDPEWPYGDHVPFLDDYVETRSRKFIVQRAADLDALRYLLVPPSALTVKAFQNDSAPLQDLARRRGLLVAGGWGVGADLIGWVYGLENMVYAAYDEPELLGGLLALIEAWNRSRMEVVLRAGVDLYIKRAWYENCDFWSPKAWKKYLAPILSRETTLAHEHGALFGCLITSNCMPLLEMMAEAGVDVIIGADPARWDLARARQSLAGRVALWGGVNGHLTVEQGDPQAVEAEVAAAFASLGSGPGFILSPVDNVREWNATSQRNVRALIEAWQRLRSENPEQAAARD
jgi:uroporphyrinogen-III decarboxylase